MLPETRSPASSTSRIGYVLKMYPRFSETFIVTEILELEALGRDLEIFSLRLPVDGRFHPDLARVHAPVTYLHPGILKPEHVWAALRRFLEEVGPLVPEQLSALAAAEPREAAQALDLARAARRDGLTHLHAHFGSVATTVARLAAALAGITYSFTAHAKDIFHEEVVDAELHDKLADAAATITVSDYNLDHLRERFGPAAARTRRLYNGIALDRFGYRDPAETEEGRRGDAPPLIAAVGRLVEKKGFDVLLDAARLLRERGLPFRLRIAGAGPLEQDLAAQIAASDLGACVELCGPLPQDGVRDLVSEAAVFAAPCRVGADGNRDGLPTVLLEAMALGTPCVATPVTGIPEVVEDGRTGLLVPEDDPVALADALSRLLAEPQLRGELARAARRLIEVSFDAARQAAAVSALFDELHPHGVVPETMPGAVQEVGAR